MKLQQRKMSREDSAAIHIQSTYRMWRTYNHYNTLKKNAMKIQRTWRSFHTRKHTQQLQASRAVLQSVMRKWLLSARLKVYFTSIIEIRILW